MFFMLSFRAAIEQTRLLSIRINARGLLEMSGLKFGKE